MAMKTELKVIIAAGVLAVLGGATYFVLKGDKTNAAQREQPAASGSSATTSALPKLKLSKEDVAAITRLEVKNKEKGDVALAKKGTKKEGDKDVDE